jgi:hypothetical protein
MRDARFSNQRPNDEFGRERYKLPPNQSAMPVAAFGKVIGAH